MSLFRNEALDYLARQRGPGEPLRITAGWPEPLFWALLVMLAVGVAASILIQVNGEPLLYVLFPALGSLLQRA